VRLRPAELVARHEPDDQAKLVFAEYRFDRPNDPGRSPDLDPVAHLDRLGLSEMAGRDRRAAGAEFIAVTPLLVQIRPTLLPPESLRTLRPTDSRTSFADRCWSAAALRSAVGGG
jgi:hypothetical protein